MIICNKCQTENVEKAKFCKSCGEILDELTNIQWKETSLLKIVGNRWKYFFKIIGFIVGLIGSISVSILYIDDYDGRDYVGVELVMSILFFISPFIILFMSICLLLLNKKKKQELQSIVSAIECTKSRYRLITKAGKLGLYDWKKRKILLPIEYNQIIAMDSGYYKIQYDNKYGIFSILLKRFIADCQYDVVSPFRNNIATIKEGDIEKRVDTQGNIF